MTHAGWGSGWNDVTLGDASSGRRRRTNQQGRGRSGRRRRLLRGIGIVVVAAVLLLVGLVVWVVVDAVRARDSLEDVAALIPQLQEQIEQGEGTGADKAAAKPAADPADRTLAALQAASSQAARSTTGVHWTVVGALPVVGDDVRALAVVSDVVDDLATDALPRLKAAADVASPAALSPQDGRVDLAPLQAAEPDVVAADQAVGVALERVEELDDAHLMGQLQGAITSLTTALEKVQVTTSTAARAAQLLPAMLGADEPRDYLVLVQNNAEPRATGGIPGAVVHLRATDGAVELLEQVAGSDLGGFDAPVLPLDGAETALFGTDLGRYMLDVNFTPDFPRSAQLASEMWRLRQGDEIDGVLSMDPVALQIVLGATGPVTVPNPLGGELQLTGDDAAAFLLNTVYLQVKEPAAQDLVFGAAAKATFDALTSGQGDAGGAVNALAESARQGRLMVWSADPAEEELLAGTVLSGELRGTQDDSPVVGVYLNAASPAKIGYYLDTAVSIDDVACRPDGSQSFTLSVTLSSRLDAKDVGGLPPYVTGAQDRSGTIRTNLLVYAPTNGGILGSDATVGDPGVFAQQHDGLVVGGRTVALAPGETQVFEYSMLSGRNQRGGLVLRTTPGARTDKNDISPFTCDETVVF